jgi:signal transduction histidine kinase
VRWTFAAEDAAEAQGMREAFLAYLRARGARGDYGAAAVIFGELVGNVVRHAPGRIAITVEWNGSTPMLSVRDFGPGFAPAPQPPSLPDPFAESGRGLYLIGLFGEKMWVDAPPDGGTVVTVALPLRRNLTANPAPTNAHLPGP